MKNKQLVLIGLTVIFALTAVILTLLYIKPTPGDGKTIVHVLFKNVEKISPGTRVYFAGHAVGVVKNILVMKEYVASRSLNDQKDMYPYELVLELDSSVNVFPQDEITIHTSGLMGEKSIAILPKPYASKAIAPVSEQDLMYGKEPLSMEETFSSLAHTIQTVDTTFSKIQAILEKNEQALSLATESIHGTADQLNTFVSNLNQEQIIAKLSACMQTGTECFVSYNALAEQALKGSGTVSRLLTSETLINDLEAATGKINMILDAVSQYGLLFHSSSGYKRLLLQKEQENKNPLSGMKELIERLQKTKQRLTQHPDALKHAALIESIDQAIQSFSNARPS